MSSLIRQYSAINFIHVFLYRLFFRICFYYLIQPFSWPFTIIPNLPLNLIEIIESPVPYLIGVLGDKKTAEGLKKNPNIKSNIYLLENNNLTIIVS